MQIQSFTFSLNTETKESTHNKGEHLTGALRGTGNVSLWDGLSYWRINRSWRLTELVLKNVHGSIRRGTKGRYNVRTPAFFSPTIHDDIVREGWIAPDIRNYGITESLVDPTDGLCVRVPIHTHTHTRTFPLPLWRKPSVQSVTLWPTPGVFNAWPAEPFAVAHRPFWKNNYKC
jgi:hypothetical protein